MKINWKVRIKSKVFWVTLIPAVLLLLSKVLELFGVSFDTSALSEQLIAIVEAAFGVLVILGIVVDPTTSGVNDSERALTYTKFDYEEAKAMGQGEEGDEE